MPPTRPQPPRGPLSGDDNDCPMARALAQISGKWKPRLLHRLMLGEAGFLELLRDFPVMNRKVLAEQLRALVRDGLVEREPQDDARASVRYRLSADGNRLAPALEALFLWSTRRGI
jgi:DNA-binding HxlR family transcriptional regulator